MTKKVRIWFAVEIPGITLVPADLVAWFGSGIDSPPGVHLHLTTVIAGQNSSQKDVNPAFLVLLITIFVTFARGLFTRRF